MTTRTVRKSKTEWPRVVQVGSVSVKVYRVKHRTNSTGFSYVLAWHTAAGRKTEPFASETEALEEAGIKARQLAAGRIEGAEMSSGDRDELQAIRKLSGDVPPLTALGEWLKARDLTGGHVLDAATAWAQKHGAQFKRVAAKSAVEEFITSKNKAGKQGGRTYGSKLRPICTFFADAFLDEITSAQWSDYLEQWDDGVTRNDHRKRAVTLCRWAQGRGYLPRGVTTEVEHTERAKENKTDIGILSPETFRAALKWIYSNAPQHLAAITVAGFCGVRSDELHGKRGDNRENRQLWEDIDLAAKHLNVTNAKTNTPAWRLVPLCDAAIAWLNLCPGEHKGKICEPGAMEEVRRLLIAAGFDLPENCLRHSYITYSIARTGDKSATATNAGNSVGEIDRRYRRPRPQAEGIAWEASTPAAAGIAADVAA